MKWNEPDKEKPEDENRGNVDEMIDSTYEDRDLPRPLTDAERLGIGEAMAQAHEEAETTENKKKAIDGELKGQIDKANETASKLARQIRFGKKIDKVQCRVVNDYRLGHIRVTRMDDGTDVVSRPMTDDERQLGMKFREEDEGK
jgi:hypothetical protein